MIETPSQKIVDAAITSRRSVRAFLPTPIDCKDIEAILRVASRAPSGTNTQPWKVYVLKNEAKAKLSSAILKAYNDPQQATQHSEEYHYYPLSWVSPYIERRRKLGWGLYTLLGIGREDKPGMHLQHGRNYQFFDAPVGMIFTIDRILQQGSWLDYGTFLQNIMIAARGRGLDTCPQQAFSQYHKIIREVLNLPDNEVVVCGMALGYADNTKIENTLVTEREPLSHFVTFLE